MDFLKDLEKNVFLSLKFIKLWTSTKGRRFCSFAFLVLGIMGKEHGSGCWNFFKSDANGPKNKTFNKSYKRPKLIRYAKGLINKHKAP
jgi:hypothetical protein